MKSKDAIALVIVITVIVLMTECVFGFPWCCNAPGLVGDRKCHLLLMNQTICNYDDFAWGCMGVRGCVQMYVGQFGSMWHMHMCIWVCVECIFRTHVCMVVCRYAGLCGSVWEYVGVHRSVRECARVCLCVPECAGDLSPNISGL